MAKDWMGTTEVAAYLGHVAIGTVHKFTKAGDLPTFKVGRTLRYRRCDADALMEKCRLNPGDLEHLIPQRNERATT